MDERRPSPTHASGRSTRTRRTFLAELAGAAACLSLAASCGEMDGGGEESSSFVVMNQDESGHLHELVISCADLAVGRAVTYVATGPHSHTVMLTDEQVTSVASGQSVTVSFTDGHSHTFIIAEPDGVC